MKVINKTKFNGDTEKIYKLIQGDSFSFSATEVNADDTERIIQSIKFNLGTQNHCKIFEKEYNNNNGIWLLFVDSDTTTLWDVGTYNSEIEIIFVDGGVKTIEQATFIVTPQNKECNVYE